MLRIGCLLQRLLSEAGIQTILEERRTSGAGSISRKVHLPMAGRKGRKTILSLTEPTEDTEKTVRSRRACDSQSIVTNKLVPLLTESHACQCSARGGQVRIGRLLQRPLSEPSIPKGPEQRARTSTPVPSLLVGSPHMREVF